MFFGSADPPSTCCPASTVAPLVTSSFDQNWEKQLQKMWCGIASTQSGCWFQMRSTEFARSGLTDDLSQVVLTFETTYPAACIHSSKRVSTRPRNAKTTQISLIKTFFPATPFKNKPHPEYQIMFWTNMDLLARILSLLERKP